MLDIEVLEKIFSKYNEYKENFRKYKELAYKNDKDSKSKDLMDYYLSESNRLLNSYFFRFSQFVTMNDNGKEYLIDLRELKKYDISSINSELKNFIVLMLEKQGSYIGNISPFDLPLLMVIKEELENIDLSDLSFEEREDELYLFNSKLTNLIRNEYNRTKLIENKDNKKIKLPFILNSDIQIQMWDDLDLLKGLLKEDEYLVEYYKILMLFGNNIEDIYKEAPIDEKEYVIDAYNYVSTKLKEDEHIRTSSSIINERVLKRRFLDK